MWLQDSKVKSLTRALKEHDRDLFAERAPNGRIDVQQKPIVTGKQIGRAHV